MGQVVSKRKVFVSGANNQDIINRIIQIEQNEYKITYYEVISGASGSLTLPTGATINAGEFGLSGNCILSKIDGSNKPTFESPKTSGGTIVTASLNEVTGDWVASGTYTDSSVALIYSIKIKAVNYSNLDYDFIIETVADGSAYIKNLTSDAQTQLNNKGSSTPVYSTKWLTAPFASLPNSIGNFAGAIFYIPISVSKTMTLTDLRMEVTAGVAASNIRLAIYNDNNGAPSTLLDQSTAISSAVIGQKDYTLVSPITIQASDQKFWLAVQASVNGVGLRSSTSGVCLNLLAGSGGTGVMSYEIQAFGAFPATSTPTLNPSQQVILMAAKLQ